MKTKILSTVLAVLLSAGALSGQSGELSVRNKTRYFHDEVRVSHSEVIALAAPWADVTSLVRHAAGLKWAAVGTGIVGGVSIGFGMAYNMIALIVGAMSGGIRGDGTLFLPGTIAMGAGLLLGGVTVAFTLASRSASRRAAALYNEYNTWNDLGAGSTGAIVTGHREVYLSLGATGGGLGLQLRF